jgi:hypothetical protein
MKSEFVAMINDCRQYSPDSWESSPKIKDINASTTVGELIDWHDQIYQKKTVSFEDGKRKEVFKKPDFLNQIHIIMKTKTSESSNDNS